MNGTVATPRRLYRSRRDRMLGGVAGGLAQYFDVDPTLVRLAFLIMAFAGIGVLAYLILWPVVPVRPVDEPEPPIAGTPATHHLREAAGYLLLGLGALLLAANLGWFDAFWGWLLWPLFLVALDLALLATHGRGAGTGALRKRDAGGGVARAAEAHSPQPAPTGRIAREDAMAYGARTERIVEAAGRPSDAARWSWRRIFRWLTISAPVAFVVGVIGHNAVAAALGIEEPVFFLLAVVGAPIALVVGVVGSAVTSVAARSASSAPACASGAPELAGAERRGPRPASSRRLSWPARGRRPLTLDARLRASWRRPRSDQEADA